MHKYKLSLYILTVILTSPSFASTISTQTETEILAVVEEKAGRVDFYDANSNALLGGSAVGSLPHEIAVASDKKLAYVSNFGIHDYDQTTGHAGDTISVIDLDTYKEVYKLITGQQNAPHGLKIRPGHDRELYVNTEVDNKIIVFDLETKKIKKTFTATPGTHNFIFSPDGTWLWLMSGNNGVTKLNADTGETLGQYKSVSPIRGLNYTSDQLHLMLSGKNEIVFLDPTSMSVTSKINNLGVDQLLYSTMTPDGKYILAPAVWNNEILIIDANNKQLVKRIVTGIDPVNVSISKNSRFAFVSNGRSHHASKIDLRDFTISEIETQPGSNGIALFSKTLSKPVITPETKDTISLGTLLPLTGSKMSTGRNLMLGYEFLRDYINQHGGIKIGDKAYHLVIHYLDTNSDETHLPALAEELQNEYRISAILNYYSKDSLKFSPLKSMAILPFFTKLAQYDQVDTFLFNDFKNQDALKKAFTDSLDLELSEDGLRSFLTLSFANHSLTKNLYLPQQSTNKPGIVLLHTSSGVKDWDYDWAKLLQARGYTVFVLDSFTPRGYIDRKTIGWEQAYQAQLDDLRYAYNLIVNIGGAEENRVGLVGFSLGGYSALRAMQLDSQGNKIDETPFKLAASFYGHAHRFNQSEFAGNIGLFWGDDDDRAPLAGAMTLVNHAKQSAIQLFHYPAAKHGFDNAYLPESVELTDEEGKIYHLGYNRTAHEQSIVDLLNYLSQLSN